MQYSCLPPTCIKIWLGKRIYSWIGCHTGHHTTGFIGFAECRLHSAKASLHSANALPSVTLGKRSANATRQSLSRQRGLCRVSDFGHSAKTLPRALALSKAATWRHSGPALCRVSASGTQQSAGPGWRHVAALPSAGSWHSANVWNFAECQGFSTRQSTVVLSCGRPLCRVYWFKHSAKWPIFLFLLHFSLCFSIQLQQIYI